MRAPQNSDHDYTPCALGRDRKQDRFGTIGGAKIPFEARGGEEAQGGSSTEVGPGVRIRFGESSTNPNVGDLARRYGDPMVYPS